MAWAETDKWINFVGTGTIGMRKIIQKMRVALWLIAFILLASCGSKDDTDIILQLIKEGAMLAEKHDLSGLMKFTSEDFLALPGKRNRRDVKRILWLAFNHYGQFSILYPEPTIDLASDNTSASSKMYLMIVRKDQSYPNLKELYKDPQGWLEEVGGNADLYRLELQLLKRESVWRVTRARLEFFRGIGFSE